MNLAQEIRSAAVPEGSVLMWWLGQAGFVFKTPAGEVVYLDPYLSHAAERLFGFKRLCVTPIEAEDVQTDLMVLTHEHADHLDPDAVPVIAKNNPRCRFAAPSRMRRRLDRVGRRRRAADRLGAESELRPRIGRGAYRARRSRRSFRHGAHAAVGFRRHSDDGDRRHLHASRAVPAAFRSEARLDFAVHQRRFREHEPYRRGADDPARQTALRDSLPLLDVRRARRRRSGGLSFTPASEFCPEVDALLLKPGEAFTIRKKPR